MELQVAAESAGERLDVVLAAAAGSRAQAQRLIADGRVLVDGRAAQKGDRVREGARVVIAEQPAPPADAAGAGNAPVARFDVAYEDDDLIVVDKPAGVVVHPARGHREG